MVGLVDGQHNKTAAGKLNKVGVLHLFVVVVAVAGNNARRRSLSCRVGRNVEVGIHHEARVRFNRELFDGHVSEVCLHDRSTNHADKHESD